jgi:Immunity protein 26
MKKQRRIIGSIHKVVLKSGLHSYIRVLDKASIAAYDILTDQDMDMEEIISKKVIFIIAVYNDVITSGKWQKIGYKPLEENLIVLPMKFVQDGLDKSLFSLYEPNTGEMTPARKEDCIGLERASVWDAHHVEDRISDYFEGKECKWMKDEIELFK